MSIDFCVAISTCLKSPIKFNISKLGSPDCLLPQAWSSLRLPCDQMVLISIYYFLITMTKYLAEIASGSEGWGSLSPSWPERHMATFLAGACGRDSVRLSGPESRECKSETKLIRPFSDSPATLTFKGSVAVEIAACSGEEAFKPWAHGGCFTVMP